MSTKINYSLRDNHKPPVELIGTWLLKGNKWVSTQSDKYLLFVERTRTPKPNQSYQYVLSVDPTGCRTYISSVYPRGGNVYKIDYKGVNYSLVRSDNNSLCISIGNCPTM